MALTARNQHTDSQKASIIRDPEDLAFYKGIVVCEFSEISQHMRALQTEEIQAIFFRLTTEQRDIFTRAKEDLEASANGKTTNREQKISLRAELKPRHTDPEFVTYDTQKKVIDGPESVRIALKLMGQFLKAANIDAHHYFVKQSPPKNWLLHCPEFMMHRDLTMGRKHPQNDIHAHVTVDAPGLAFRKYDIPLAPRQRVPEGYGVLFNATWLHGVPRSVKRTGRTAFGAYMDSYEKFGHPAPIADQ